ncbi:acyl-ACP--UDP-N-acetylglucosamine O-acyltransferase [Bacteroides sp.]|uniref:acyl-ACP--UDP-N-acetylglucosamine O-acyltransferase n=1 Tax=Bacteroides sp. TaxID=29523 RepID=UPI004028CA65
MISLTSYISPEARIGRNVEIAPFVYIGSNVEIGDDCEIMPYTSVLSGTTLGCGNRVYAGTILGAAPMFSEKEEHSRLIIGNDNIFRENCVITTGSHARPTRIGNGNFAGADVSIQAGTVVGNGTTIHAGCKIGERCELNDTVLLQHMALLNPDVHIGMLAEISALCNVSDNVPPYMTFGGTGARGFSLDEERLRKAGISDMAIDRLRIFCYLTRQTAVSPSDAIQRIETKYGSCEELKRLANEIRYE